MSYAPIAVAARRVLLDALEALDQQQGAMVLVGAQAIYLYTGDADVAIATTTKDSDVALIPARLSAEPTLDAALTSAGFTHDRSTQQPGKWSSAAEFDPPIELLVPAGLHGGGGRRGARIPPHSKYAARVVPGLEAAAMSHHSMTVTSLEPDQDARAITTRVASPAGLLVAKAYKIGERAATAADRLLDKDAHDLGRLMSVDQLEAAAVALGELLSDGVFLGGASVGLWRTDEAARPVRLTVDVDVVAEVTTLGAYAEFQEALRKQGFREDIASGVTCRWRGGDEVVLDAIPANPRLAGMSGEWLGPAVAGATQHVLPFRGRRAARRRPRGAASGGR